jgi:hypothetical protein
MIQSGDGDWIINSILSGIESQMLQDALIQDRISVLKGQKAFYLAGTSPPNKEMSSPCPPCLCGEKAILDKIVLK